MCDMLSVSIDPHKSGVLREKNNFCEICENIVLLEVHNRFVFCLTNKVSKRVDVQQKWYYITKDNPQN